MNALIASREGTGYCGFLGEVPPGLRLWLSWLMAEEQRKRWYHFDPDRPPSDAFMEYLEGYASSVDIYQVCSRPVATSNYDLLLSDFWRQYAADMAAALAEHSARRDTVELIENSDAEATPRGQPAAESR